MTEQNTAAQNTTNPTATTNPDANSTTIPLQQSDLNEFATIIREHPGAKVKIMWRTRAHGRFIKAGSWATDTGVVGVEEDGHPQIELESLGDDLFRSFVPFPSPDCEYGNLEIVEVPRKLQVKRPREEPSAGKPQQPEVADLASAFLDSKIKKATSIVQTHKQPRHTHPWPHSRTSGYRRSRTEPCHGQVAARRRWLATGGIAAPPLLWGVETSAPRARAAKPDGDLTGPTAWSQRPNAPPASGSNRR